jgi:8-oxo-dGTP pyrophosphatase MutT (NUDIX family)
MPLSPYIARLRQKIGHDMLLLPAVSAIILDDQNRILLHRASDDGNWYTIGGAIDPGEEPAAAAVREALEETGLHIEPIRIVAVQSSPPVTYSNGDQCQYIGIAFLCRITGGNLHIADDESLELRFFGENELPDLRADQRERVRYAMSGNPMPLFKSVKEENESRAR